MLALYLTALLGLSTHDREEIQLLDTTVVSNTTTREVVKDTLTIDDAPLPMRGENLLIIQMVGSTKMGSDDGRYTEGLAIFGMSTITSPSIRGEHMVRGAGQGSTLIEAQRNAWSNVMLDGVKTSQSSRSGVTKDGLVVNSLTYQKRAWVSHYVMKSMTEDGIVGVHLIAYADLR